MTERAKPQDADARPGKAAEHHALPTPREVEDKIAKRRPMVTGRARSGAS
jgi:hypothetical protein